MAALQFEYELDGDYWLSEDGSEDNNVFTVLIDFLQPNSKTTMADTKTKLLSGLPKNEPYTGKVASFAIACIVLAEQIPLSHPALPKLARITFEVLDSQEFSDEDRETEFWRFQYLKEKFRDQNPYPDVDNNNSRYTRCTAFQALFYKLTWPTYSGTAAAVSSLRSSFERTTISDETWREGTIMASAQWVVHFGDCILQEILHPLPGHDYSEDYWLAEKYQQPAPDADPEASWLQTYVPGSSLVFPTNQTASVSESKPSRLLTLHRWHFWRNGFQSVAKGEGASADYSQECRELCTAAARKMIELEKAAMPKGWLASMFG